MPYYVLQRGAGELYAMNMTLSEDEARQYDQEGEMVPVRAVFIWTSFDTLKLFQQFLSIEQRNPHSSSPRAELVA